MHESQSRFFENIIGRSRDFWVPVYGKLQEIFPDPFEKIELDQFVEAINQVHPDLIRTEADELTYSLHVLIRYEIEKMLIEGELDVEKLPEIWADKYEDVYKRQVYGRRGKHVPEICGSVSGSWKGRLQS